jgi:hypothetical protein
MKIGLLCIVSSPFRTVNLKHSEPNKQGDYQGPNQSETKKNPCHLADGSLRGCASLWLDNDASITSTFGTKKLAKEHAAVAAVTEHRVGVIPETDWHRGTSLPESPRVGCSYCGDSLPLL